MKNEDNLYKFLKGKRIAGIDYGLKRTAIAVCDELHISITPKLVFDTQNANFINDLINYITNEKIAAVVIGIPVREDDNKSEVVEAIQYFKMKLEEKLIVPIFLIDESYSTIEATKIMIKIGKSKKKRKLKGNKDLIAAVIILKSFIDENGL